MEKISEETKDIIIPKSNEAEKIQTKTNGETVRTIDIAQTGLRTYKTQIMNAYIDGPDVIIETPSNRLQEGEMGERIIIPVRDVQKILQKIFVS